MKCPNCNRWNEVNAKFCNYCGYNILEDHPYQNELQEQKSKKKQDKGKTKNKKINKTKTVKEKVKNKDKKNKQDKNQVVVVKQMSFLQKFLVFLLFLFFLVVLGVAGFLGYHIYDTEVTEVPNVVGLNIEDATKVMEDAGLRVSQKEVETENNAENNLVLSQSVEQGEKVSKYKKIKLTVGIYKETLKMPDFKNLSIDSVTSFLDEKGIEYKIQYKESDSSDGVVIKQSIKANTEIDTDQVITLTVTKRKEQESSMQGNEEYPTEVPDNEEIVEEEKEME